MATQFSISDLAKEFDLTTRAIRFYEDMGLLEPERSGPGGRNRPIRPTSSSNKPIVSIGSRVVLF